jgi:hypothetical protein
LRPFSERTERRPRGSWRNIRITSTHSFAIGLRRERISWTTSSRTSSWPHSAACRVSWATLRFGRGGLALLDTRSKRTITQRLREPEPLADNGEAPEPAAGGIPVDELIDRERLEAKTQRVLRHLPEGYGLALLWRYWESRSVRQMAEATGKTEKAIERLLARARARFRELWDHVSLWTTIAGSNNWPTWRRPSAPQRG